MDIAFCIVGEDGNRFSGCGGVVVDVIAGFGKTHTFHVEEQAYPLLESQVAGKFEGSSELRLTAEDEADFVLRIGAEVNTTSKLVA